MVVMVVQVEQELPDDDRTVTEMYIRGWKVDVAMMEVLQQCWLVLPVLHTLHLWNAGLAADTLALLAGCLPQCRRLQTLVLDGNPLGELRVSELVGAPAGQSRLLHLSLRFCGLGDAAAVGLGHALGWPSAGPAPPLLTLHLSNNAVGDRGAAGLAVGLTTNRTLLTLNLANNAVGDEGAARLAEALSWFAPSEGQLSARRLMIHEQLLDTAEPEGAEYPSPRAPRPSMHPGSPARVKRPSDGARLRPNRREGKRKSDPRKKPSSHAHVGPWAPVPPPPPPPQTRVKAAGPRPERFSKEDRQVPAHGSHPLLRGGYLHDGEVWLPGSLALISLNLSRNRVGERGVAALLAAVEDQCRPLVCDEWQPGLLRLPLHRNAFPAPCPPALRLMHRLRLRDPAFRFARIDLAKVSVSPCALPPRVLF